MIPTPITPATLVARLSRYSCNVAEVAAYTSKEPADVADELAGLDDDFPDPWWRPIGWGS